MNFQNHRKTHLQISPNLTVIAGTNGAGKTAILRALSGVLLNTMSARHISRGKAKTSVAVKLDGRWIRRTRTKSRNEYKIDGKPLVSFKTGVPPEIEEFVQICPQTFQRQTEGMFWIDSPSGQVAKELNKLIDCEEIDIAQANLRSKLRETQSRLDEVEEQYQAAATEVDELKWVAEATEHLEELEQVQSQASQMRSRLERLQDLIAEAQEQERILATYSENEVTALRSGLESIREQMAITSTSFQRISKLCLDLQNQSQLLKSLQKKKEVLQKKLESVKTCPLCQQATSHWHS